MFWERVTLPESLFIEGKDSAHALVPSSSRLLSLLPHVVLSLLTQVVLIFSIISISSYIFSSSMTRLVSQGLITITNRNQLHFFDATLHSRLIAGNKNTFNFAIACSSVTWSLDKNFSRQRSKIFCNRMDVYVFNQRKSYRYLINLHIVARSNQFCLIAYVLTVYGLL